MNHEIVVGNIGCVYSGKNVKEAVVTFQTYTEYSKSGYGRAAGEAVTWLLNGEIYKEYFPPEDNDQ